MSDYPTPSEYQEAVQFPDTAFADDELAGAEPRTNVLGLPQPITGAFAAVFPMTTRAGTRYAAKCFLSDSSDQRARYRAVSEALEELDLDAAVGFDYQPGGIRVDGEAYPLLKMEWVEGMTLNRFVEAHLDDPDVLGRLADAWAELMAELESNAIAHGDLQHGNVLVETAREDGERDLHLRLVDYDTTYVPALDGRSSAEVGHRNYQHPDRTDTDFGPHLDRFPGLVVYTALRACMAHPHLWEEYDTGENLLFRDADFYDPASSPLFEVLQASDAVGDIASALQRACYVELADVPALQDVVEGRAETSVGALEADRASRRRSERRHRSRRGLVARFFLPAAAAVAVGATALAAFGWSGAALALALGGLGVGVGTITARYRRRPLVRRRRRLEQEIQRFDRLLHNLRRQVKSLQRQRASLLDSMEERRAERLQEVQEEALYDHLKHHFVGEARDVEGVHHKHVVRLKAANIRTAYEATPDRIADLRRVPGDVKAQLRMWRASLVREYEDEIPDALSPAEERRLERYVQQRVEEIDAQIQRAREKIEVQKAERERIRTRNEEMPVLTPARYVGYLLRLASLPAIGDGPPTPRSSNGQARSTGTATDSSDRTAVPDPLPADDDRPWWQHGG
jgi:hypothetical protein